MLIRLIFSLLICTLLSPSYVFADTHAAATCENKAGQLDVQAAVNLAAAGDVVTVPSGSCTWTTGVSITLPITLQGAGIGVTNILGNVSVAPDGLVKFVPSSPSSTVFRVTGFTMDMDSKSNGIYLYHEQAGVQTIRIDNNAISNPGGTSAGRDVWIEGNFKGVIHSNTFTNSGAIKVIDGYAKNKTGWDYAYTFGDDNTVFYEDNAITMSDTPHSGGHGGRYVARYNTYTYTHDTNGLFPWFDMHGNQRYLCEDGWSTVQAEVYGNKITSTNNKAIGMFDHRGGQVLFFYNYAITSNGVNFKMREEFCDDTCTSQGWTASYPMHVHNSYYWGLKSSSGTVACQADTCPGNSCGTDTISVNQEFWMPNASFNGAATVGDKTTGGTGCGTLANIPGTCTTGVAYWATDQSCSTITDYVGASPSTPISGTLYKCTATDTWTAYYVPYTYPHPLRGESDTTAPTIVSSSIDETGLILTTTHSETMVATITTGLALTCSGGAVTATYSATNGAIITHGLNRAVKQGEVCTTTYTQPGNGYEDLALNDLATYTDQAVVNGSTVQSETTYQLSLTVVGGGTVNSSQGGIQCTAANSPCTKTCDSGTVITFTPIQYNGWNTGSWSGTGCGASTTMSEARTCTYTFTEIKLWP